jgi:AbiV family abortive infection protein
MNSCKFKRAIASSIENGDRLLQDAKYMMELSRFPTSYALAIFAQEEYAKALLLCLVDTGAIPWSANVGRALRDHVCKQLVSVILDYLSPDTEEFLARYNFTQIGKPRPIFPTDVIDAIHMICYERIPHENYRWWIDPGERPIAQKVKAIADGKLDQQKQHAIYVHVGKTCEVCSLPSQVSEAAAKAEVDRSQRIGDHLRPYDGAPGLRDTLDSEKLIAFFRLLTGTLSPEDFGANWWAR